MKKSLLLFPLASAMHVSAEDHVLHSFAKTKLSDQFWAEGATFIDVNKDGKKDVAAGPFWYAAPDFTQKREIYPATTTFDRKKQDGSLQKIPGFEGALGKENKYSDNFFAFGRDFNGDGWEDLLVIGFPGQWTAWYENPKAEERHWTKHVVWRITDNESPTFTDITGDGKPELVCASGGRYGYATADAGDASAPWTWHPISPVRGYQRFTHGLGIGDVNGDKRADLIEKDGWWEQPPSLEQDPAWTFHAIPFNSGGAQMYAYDVNGDGLNDVITSQAAHGYGLAWHEQMREGLEIKFLPHVFMNKDPKDNRYGVRFGELHAIELADMDGDGLKDIVTGKRFWSHGSQGDTASAVKSPLYWFQLKRNEDKTVDWLPHLIDGESGVGTQIVVDDWNGDKLPDVVAANKLGAFVLTHQIKKVTRDEWEKAQPKALVGAP
ncbi:MAG: FG-GAP repeat domain-containing protein [Verrucomicrobiales bacterium]